MKVTKNVIEKVTVALIGEDAVPVLMYLKGKQNISEFKVAHDMKLDIHEARTILYKLYENNLATFYRKKDKQKGWYVCYWNYDATQLKFLYAKIKKNNLEKLELRLEKEESGDFYMCRKACSRMDFDRAVEFNFKCPECGDIMQPVDNKRTKEFLKEKIQGLKKEIGEIAG